MVPKSESLQKLHSLGSMKPKAIFAASLLLAAGVMDVSADDPFANVLIQYDFNTLTHDWDSNIPAYCAPCVWTTDLSLSNLNQGLHVGGPDGSKFKCFEGWDTVYDYSFVRTDLSPHAGTLSYNVFVRDQMMAEISGLSLDWKRPSSTTADAIQASIFWEDTSGDIQYRTTGPVDLIGTGAWNHLDLDFSSGSSLLPSGTDGSGRQFHVELYAWGQNGDALFLDNIILKGDCAPIPEPGGVVMIAAAALALILRRRGRA